MKQFRALILCLIGLSQTAVGGPWRPTLTASADKTTVRPGETITVTYSTSNATGGLYFIHQLGEWIGLSDGISLPLPSGSFTSTPAIPGEYVIRIMAVRRLTDLNQSGQSEGRRRAVIVEIPIKVVGPPEAVRGSLTITPSTVKPGEKVTRTWTSSGGQTFLDGQPVPPSGSDTFVPTKSFTSVLQVVRHRWDILKLKATCEVQEAP